MTYKIKSEIILEEFKLINAQLKENGYKNRFKKIFNESASREERTLSSKDTIEKFLKQYTNIPNND